MVVQTHVNDHLTGLFWADDTLKSNYNEFGDVLSFDATYQTNKYSMVLVLFNGVDHHKHYVTFTDGLLARDIANAYVWLFDECRKAFVNQPMMIIDVNVYNHYGIFNVHHKNLKVDGQQC
uniref:MULE transposase domain-containing protein n=1 Tax=Lactuca sativa TaxID=4236 RepID=A0A9R1V5M8_LACSA|nr:hypothetical protein LSAT_V11C600305100 [Lactuca sativa]